MSDPVPRVMQSFRAPRPTTNPYITMLDSALTAEPTIEHLRFSWRTALTTRVDVLHLQWPETLLQGSTRAKRLARRIAMRMLLIKLRMTGGVIVRTVHNLSAHESVAPPTRKLLDRIERDTAHRIVLNASTPVDGSPSTLIPHGHYRDWFASITPSDAVPGQLGYFGLVRPYKGLETLLEAYSALVGRDGGISLRIGGSPTSPEIAGSIRRAAEGVPRVRTSLHFLDDAELVEIATTSQLVVLPYRAMHNSGSALAALSLNRPVLVPDNETNRALRDEVGDGWVLTFEGELDADALSSALADLQQPHPATPDLSARGWDEVGRAHSRAYHRALGKVIP